MFLDVPDSLFFKLFLHAVLFPSIFASAYFSRLQRCSYVLSIVTFCFYSEPEIMRHCRSGIAASIYSGIAASIYSGIAANMHSHSGIAASMQRHCRHAALPPVCSGTAAMQRALTAALPPACVHSGSAASMHSLRHCRQQALTCSGIAAILSSVRGSAAPSELMLQFRLISVCLVWGSISGHPFLFGATWLASSSSAT